MPLALEPGKTFEVSLPGDRSKPEAERPTFVFRHLSCREYRVVAEQADKQSELDGILSVIRSMLTGWRNMGDLIAPDDLDAAIAPSEAGTLLNLALAGGTVTVADAKK